MLAVLLWAYGLALDLGCWPLRGKGIPMKGKATRWSLVVCVAMAGLSGAAGAQDFRVSKTSIGGEGGHDYILAEAGCGRVFISRETHIMVVDGATGKILGDIADTPRVHGIALVPRWNHGFTTNGGDSTVTMFDLKTLVPIRKIPVKLGGLDGIMYDESIDRVILTNHSRPIGSAVAIDANSGEITGTAELADTGPEGAASDGKGRLFVNLEGKDTIQVVDAASMKAIASWPIACEGPTGIAFDKATNRIFAGCSKTSAVVDAATGKVVASIRNGDGVDALAWDPADKLIYIPAGRDGNVTVVHQDSADKYTVVATVATMRGGKTITVDPVKHVAYVFAPEYGPAPQPAPDAPPPAVPGRGPRGPLIGTWFFTISH
jgi:DNA-binding beta-propeller fold protein YncE